MNFNEMTAMLVKFLAKEEYFAEPFNTIARPYQKAVTKDMIANLIKIMMDNDYYQEPFAQLVGYYPNVHDGKIIHYKRYLEYKRYNKFSRDGLKFYRKYINDVGMENKVKSKDKVIMADYFNPEHNPPKVFMVEGLKELMNSARNIPSGIKLKQIIVFLDDQYEVIIISSDQRMKLDARYKSTGTYMERLKYLGLKQDDLQSYDSWCIRRFTSFDFQNNDSGEYLNSGEYLTFI